MMEMNSVSIIGQSSNLITIPEIEKQKLVEFTMDEVAKHKTVETRIWVTHNDLVYDVTDFVSSHPGGLSKIMLAAGGSVDPFWNLYQQHKTGSTGQEVEKIIRQYLIGRLKSNPITQMHVANDPYSNDPPRSPFIRPESLKPFNGEPPSPLLVDNYFTPKDLFYIRNHLPVPDLDAKIHRVSVGADGIDSISFSVDELKQLFPCYKVSATIQCGGNRRSEMIKEKPVKGLNWGVSAISNAEWTGVLLRDLLLYAGLTDEIIEMRSLRHVQFEGLDEAGGTNYGASIPIDKAWDPKGDVLVAFEMNGEPLTRDHGFPLRVITPGIVGARSVKYVGKIYASGEESPSHWQQKDYKSFQPGTDWNNVDWKSANAIQDMPVTSAICDPVVDQRVSLDNDEIVVKGYAWSGGGRSIIRVDVSTDDGNTWKSAELLPTITGRHGADQDLSTKLTAPRIDLPYNPRAWSWTHWIAKLPFDEKQAKKACETNQCNVTLLSRAVDSSYNAQPDSVKAIWNMRGVCNNAWHRVNVKVPNPDEIKV